jgi:hypothetical protein
MTQDELDHLKELASQAHNGDLDALLTINYEIGPAKALEILAEHAAMEFALRRIALGIAGRQEAGLPSGEAEPYLAVRRSRPDWELAQDVLRKLGRP